MNTTTQEPDVSALTAAVDELRDKLSGAMLDVAAIGGWRSVFLAIVQAASTHGMEDGHIAGVAQVAADFIARG